jgi:hypothetical protein
MTTIVEQITLECLTKKNKTCSNTFLEEKKEERKEQEKREKKFYRKRILQVTRDLLLKKECHVNTDIVSSLDNYIRACIRHFQALDTNDIYQDAFLLEEKEEKETNQLLEFVKNEKNDYDALMMRKISVEKTLDTFVKKTIVKKSEIILPKEKEVNLLEPKLREKGVVKKKNIDIVYDKKEQKEQK